MNSFISKRARFAVFAALLLVFFVSAASHAQAQTRRRSTTTRRTTTAARPKNAAAIAEGRNRLANQLKLLTQFVYLYGRISTNVEATDEQIRRGALPAEARASVNQSRASLRNNLQNVREGIEAMEQYFRTTPGLEKYYTQLAGVSAAASDAEELAASNQLDLAGRKLVNIASQLADVLADMQ